MRRTPALFAVAAVAAAAVLGTSRPAAAVTCLECVWGLGCTWTDVGTNECETIWMGAEAVCLYGTDECGPLLTMEGVNVAPDGTLAPGSYEAAVRLAAGGSDGVRDGVTLACNGAVLARHYAPAEAERLREATRRILI